MASSRDSSIWRNLAVTFGGGLALGAVGMRITQTALRPVDAPLRPENNDVVADRLNGMENRLERMERTPAPSPVAPAPVHAPAASSPIDQKVLEAVVGAVDARLHEHASQVERRVADLEAKFTVEIQTLHRQGRQLVENAGKNVAEMQALRRQDQLIAESTEQRFAEMDSQFQQHTGELQKSMDGKLGDLTDTVSQIVENLGQFRISISEEIAGQIDRQGADLERSLEARIVTAAAAAAATQFDDQLAPLRAEVAQKERELTELRRRLAESERTVVEAILSIGDVCRQAADRFGAGHSEALPPEPPTPRTAEPAAKVEPPAPVEEPPAPRQPAVAMEAADPSLAQSIPDFAREANRTRPWRIPLVSSFLVATAGTCLALVHYL